MKTFIKFIISFVLGCVIVCVGVSMGGLNDVNVYVPTFSFNTHRISDITTEYAIEESESINLELFNANVKIIEENRDNTIKVEAKNLYDDFYIDRNVILMTQTHTFLKSNRTAEILIYVPDGFKFENANISLNAGKIQVEKLKANNIYLDTNAGNLVLMNSICYSNLESRCSFGNTSIELNQPNDFAYMLQTSVGSINVNEVSLNGINQSYSSLNQSHQMIDASCDVGKIDIRVKER